MSSRVTGLRAAFVRLSLGGAVALLSALLAVGVALAEEDRQAVLLRETTLLPPVETSGTGLEPEVKVRLTIDERGVVRQVDVVSIRPESEYDGAFRRHTIEELMHWRYAPAVRDGLPAAETQEWIVQYRALRPEDWAGSSTTGLIPGFLAAREDAASRHARVMSLPVEKRKEILLALSEVAEKYLIPGRRQQFSTEQFVVVSDSESPELTEIIAHNLEVALSVIHRLVQPHIEPQPSDLKILVYLYSQREAFDRMRAELTPLAGMEATYYAPGLTTYHLELPSSDDLLSLLIHETSHGYSDHYLRRAGFPFPRWFEEGFAEYMGNSRVKKGQLLPGRTLKRQFVLTHQVGVLKRTTGAGWDLARVQEALRKREGLTLEELVAADRDIFYGDRAHLYYGMSWLLVHFLRHGEPQWADDNFPTLMLYLAEGYPGRAAVETAYGRDLASLETSFLEYARRF